MVGSIEKRGPRRNLAPGARITVPAVAFALLATVSMQASAQQDDTGGPLDRVLESMQLKGRAAPPSGFVRDSRPATAHDFMPVGVPRPDRPTKAMTPAEVAAAEADLDAARERQQRRAGHKPAVVPLKTAKGAAPSKSTPR